MKRLIRPIIPESLNHEHPQTKLTLIEWYASVSHGNMQSSHWRKEDILDALLAMSGSCCAYCGVILVRGAHQVEHYLPKSLSDKKPGFPYLAYCWDNLFPSCSACNHAKSDYIPPALQGKQFKDSVLESEAHYAELPQFLLTDIQDISERLFHPILDDPYEHFDFLVIGYCFVGKTEGIGKITVKQLFKKDKRFALRLEMINKRLKEELQYGKTAEEVIVRYTELVGYEFIIRKMVEDFFLTVPTTTANDI